MASSVLSTTMTPFLFHTQTLAASALSKSVIQPQMINIIFRRKYKKLTHGKQIRRTPVSLWKGSDREKATWVRHDNKIDDSEADRNNLVIRRTTNMHGPEASIPVKWDARSTDESGDGVVRRTWKAPAETLLEDPMNTERGNVNQRGRRTGDVFDETDNFKTSRASSIDFVEDEGMYEEIDAIDQLVRQSGPEDERTSTITPSEKHAFQKIFSDIFARSQQAQQTQRDPFDEEALELTNFGKVKEVAPKERDKKLHDIMRQAAAQSQEQKEAAVNRYPAPLRAAAARAIGLKLDAGPMLEEANSLEEDIFFNNKLEELRKPERTRVESLMQEAKTDFELWAIMEREVFPLIARLGLSDSKEENDANAVHERKTKRFSERGRRESGSDLGSKSFIAPTLTLLESPEDNISALALYGPLYPSYLLLGLRLLDRSFAKPSALTLSLLPKIKSLGLISHVLGASTQFYNELIVISWFRYDDFIGAEGLLKEMEQSGLDWDAETLKVVRNIADIQTATLRGDRGIYLKALWSLPEFAPRRFRPWKEKIQQALDQRDPDVFLTY